MTRKQNPVELDALQIILHSATEGQSLEEYMGRVVDYSRKRVHIVHKGLKYG